MSKLSTIFSMLALPMILIATSANGSVRSDSVLMSSGYINEVYYSMSAGAVQTSPRATWDIAFRTMKVSSSILTNDGSGVVLYTYPKSDTSGWASIDTTGLFGWTPMYNDPSDWENGAFSRNGKGHPDYGWGIYNMSTHNLTGDSIFIIKLRDNSFRKLWIVGKKSAANIYTFRFAHLDGTGEQTIALDLNAFEGMEFYGYSLQANEPVAFQPSKTSWDILFTKYMSVQPNGTPYPVIGVLTNNPVSTEKFYPVPLTYSDFGAGTWDSTRSAIGWEWKTFNMQTFAYDIADSTVYFVKQTSGDIYKMYFTYFAGTSTGLVRFEVAKSASAGILDPASGYQVLTVYPNPAKDFIHIELPDRHATGLTISLTDLTGRQLRADQPAGSADGSNVYSLDVTGVQPGIYLVTLSTAAGKRVAKVMINR